MARTDALDRLFPRSDAFATRHLGPRAKDHEAMLATCKVGSMDDLLDKAIPGAVRWHGTLQSPAALGEQQALAELKELAGRNRVLRSFLGMGYHGTFTPPVILRNITENPAWYTQYTPYQPEISQGRLEALLNFQTMVLDLTGLECANASLLDEATAAAEAMTMFKRVLGKAADGKDVFLVADDCHPQTIGVVRTRAEPLGIEVRVLPQSEFTFGDDVYGCLVQYPSTTGAVVSPAAVIEKAHAAGALCCVAADVLSLTLLKEPGAWDADAVVGSTQRFGVPLGYGGPHAAFMATREDYKRQMPGRIIGVTKDRHGNMALRMALQTREQHIRRDKATSNICTAQVLLSVMAGMYAVYHGPAGLRAIAERIRNTTGILAKGLEGIGCEVQNAHFFDAIQVAPKTSAKDVVAKALALGINLRDFGDGTVGVAFDETVTEQDLRNVFAAFGGDPAGLDIEALADQVPALPADVARSSDYLTHPVFHLYRSETEMLRYMHRLQQKDLSLTTSMIPLGSCTMKLNATAEMIPVTWEGFGGLHPFVPRDQAEGYTELHHRLETWLNDITGFAATSLQPNAGSQGEYTGLLTIRAWHQARGQGHRNVCLIPSSAHGTNPASAIMCGMKVVVVACDDHGNIDVADLKKKADQHSDALAALMVTYPSTHGVFEASIREICTIIHEHGGKVYLDGANMNAQVGLCKPGDLGADVCHLNLHKTFCIPHGGGGPGMGPICVNEDLAPFLPGHPVVEGVGGSQAIGPVSAAPWGSPSILPISYAYIAMMGPDGLRQATEVSILNANYIAFRLQGHYPVLYKSVQGYVAHECILDCRAFEKSAHVTVADIAKRLMDFGFHAPTMSWPVAGTLMVEPTESESKEELDRFCDALIAIRDEIRAIENGSLSHDESPLAHAPHTQGDVLRAEWDRKYSREQAAFPAPWTKAHKFWPMVGRVDDVYGDRNLVCACPPLEAYAE